MQTIEKQLEGIQEQLEMLKVKFAEHFPPQLQTVPQFCANYPAFSPSALRWHIHRADSNRMNELGVIVRINKRIYIDVDRFNQWIDSYR